MFLAVHHKLSDCIYRHGSSFEPNENDICLCVNSFMMCSHILTFHHFNTGMSELVKERPANPVQWLASYLLRHDPQKPNQS